ncbi:MAG: hypothetical protein K6U07_10255, partial [Firmicutes bacterium]|nr:hypothetical protein [Bacillota bacterium]
MELLASDELGAVVVYECAECGYQAKERVEEVLERAEVLGAHVLGVDRDNETHLVREPQDVLLLGVHVPRGAPNPAIRRGRLGMDQHGR